MKPNFIKKMLILSIVFLFVGGIIGPLKAETPMISTTVIKQDQSILPHGVYQLLIITPSVFKKALEPLVLHKNTMGLSTRLVTLDEVYEQMYWQGCDNAEKVKYFIKTAVEEWSVHYVLLVGGRSSQFLPTWYCPVRYVQMVDDWMSRSSATSISQISMMHREIFLVGTVITMGTTESGMADKQRKIQTLTSSQTSPSAGSPAEMSMK
jgi:hypothetical protein